MTKENKEKSKVISGQEVEIKDLNKNIFDLQSTSHILKLTKELNKEKEENKGLRRELQRCKQFITEIFSVKAVEELLEKLGFMENTIRFFKKKERNVKMIPDNQIQQARNTDMVEFLSEPTAILSSL